ncbi:chymotrypsinogen A-like isoform X2 [Panulirus ornatus]|uniref:chymotrypsinogen A-like isoform X2 n=1 Tax=Panulirus ornatus TaxID=150431 RepID=UPI003A839F4D
MKKCRSKHLGLQVCINQGICVSKCLSIKVFKSPKSWKRQSKRLESGDSVTVSSLTPVQDCDHTFRLDDGEAALIYSRQDLYMYDCTQTFEAISQNSNLVVACQHFHLKFNCFMESLKIDVDDEEETYCRKAEIGARSGKKVVVRYHRVLGLVHGGYVCTVTASSPAASKKLTSSCVTCGVTAAMEMEANRNDAQRVVGGVAARKNEHPWMAFLVVTVGTYQFRCGGSIISDTLLLSAAHCFSGYNIKLIDVGLGKLDVSAYNEAGAVWLQTTKYVVHPQYNDVAIQNDLALVILPEAVAFTEAIRPICLPAGDNDFAGATATATGWGALQYGGYEAKVLQEVELDVWGNSACQAAWREKFQDQGFTLLSSQVCAVGLDKDTCSGDSGGPLIVKVSGRWELLGVTSYGFECAVKGLPGVYSRASKFLTWIESYIPKNDSCHATR